MHASHSIHTPPRHARLLRWAVALIVLTVSHSAFATNFDDFAPDKTGATNVSALLQEAVRVAARTDRLLILSPGRYWVSEPVTVRGNGITLASSMPVAASSVVLSGYGAHVPPEDRTGTNAPPRPAAILQTVKPAYNLTVAGITFEHAMAGVTGVVAVSRFEKCAFANCDLGVSGDPLQIVMFSSCAFAGGRIGIHGGEPAGRGLDRSNLVNIYDCTFRGQTGWAVQIEGSPTNIRDCDFEGCPGGAIHLLDIYVANVTGSYFEGCGRAGPALIRVGQSQLALGGQLNFFGNQVNHNQAGTIFHVTRGYRLHAYDNQIAVAYSKGQQFVTADDHPGPHLRYENNRVQDPAIP